MLIVADNNAEGWEALRVRHFFDGNKEIIEMFSSPYTSTCGKVVYHYENTVGETLLHFCSDDKDEEMPTLIVLNGCVELAELIRRKKEIRKNTKLLIEYLEDVIRKSPYFAFLYTAAMALSDKYIKTDIETLFEVLSNYHDEYSEAQKVITDHLRYIENPPDGVSDGKSSADADIMPIWKRMDHMHYEPIYSHDGISSVLSADMYLELKSSGKPVPAYHMDYVVYPSAFSDMIAYVISEHIKRGIRVKKCKNCGRDFIATRNNQIDYCDRMVSSTGKTCRQIGATRVYQSKQNENPIIREYNKAYKTHNARVRYGLMTKEEFRQWSVKARELRDKCLNGEMCMEDFVKWLKI